MNLRLEKLYLPSILLLLALQATEVHAMTETKEKIRVGGIEEVVLLPWGIRLPARVDTGATRSSLDARDIRAVGDMIEFRLPEKYGGTRLRAPVKGRRNIRTAHGVMKRFVVEIELCIGAKRIPTSINLAHDRSKMSYPLLIGRDVLINDFIVDVSESNLLPPTCPVDGAIK